MPSTYRGSLLPFPIQPNFNLRTKILILSILVTFYAVGAAFAQTGASDQIEHQHEQQRKQKYTCPMHPEVVTDHPGNCPKCGMTLVPLKENGKRRTPNTERRMPKSEQASHQQMTDDANGM